MMALETATPPDELSQLLRPPVTYQNSAFDDPKVQARFLARIGAKTLAELRGEDPAGTIETLMPFVALIRQYLTDADAVEILHEFRESERWRSDNQVLWTGMQQEKVQEWADEHGYMTLTKALGRLKDPAHPAYARRRHESHGAWSKYMKGASALFALCIAQEAHGSVILVTPPPGDRFHPSGLTNFQLLEGPILAGVWGPSYLEKIEVAHPDVADAADTKYQFWPTDQAGEWNKKYGQCPHKKVVPREVKGWKPWKKSVGRPEEPLFRLPKPRGFMPKWLDESGGCKKENSLDNGEEHHGKNWAKNRRRKEKKRAEREEKEQKEKARLGLSRRDKQKYREKLRQQEPEVWHAEKQERPAQSRQGKKLHEEDWTNTVVSLLYKLAQGLNSNKSKRR